MADDDNAVADEAEKEAEENAGGDGKDNKDSGNNNSNSGREQFWRNISGVRPSGGTLSILIACIIAFFDNKFYYFPFLGDVYHGFKLSGLLNVDWFGLAVSGVFLGIVIFFYLREMMAGRTTFFVVAVIATVATSLNTYIRLPLINSLSFGSYLNIGLLVLIGIIALLWKLKTKANTFRTEDFTILLLAFVYTFFFRFNNWATDPKALLHFGFITLFGFLYIRPIEEQNGSPARWHLFIVFFLITDFFFTGILENYSWLRFVPLIVFGTVIYVNQVEPKNKWAILVIIIALLSIVLAQASASGYIGDFTFVKNTEYKTLKDYKSITDRIKDAVKSWTENRLEIATGGLYQGVVEKNRYEQLGVYIDNVRTADPKFYSTEEVTVWGTVKAKTLSEPSKVTFSCDRWYKEGDQNVKYQAKSVIPSKPFTIYNLEENDFECVFEPLEGGTHTITMSSLYNFETDSYHKSYFIDRDRYRSMLRERIDPFKQAGIEDTSPVTVSTNGPVEVDMNVQNLIGVVKQSSTPSEAGQSIDTSEDATTHLTILGMQLKNRGSVDEGNNVVGTYEGKIKNIKEFVVLLPKGVTIPNEGADCKPVKFKPYALGTCMSTCTSVKDSCNTECDKTYESDYNSKTKCKDRCIVYNGCMNDCKILFSSDDGTTTDYNGYKIDLDDLNEKSKDNNNYYSDIDKYRTFACQIEPDETVLGDSSITTRYIRTRVKYDYLHQKSVNVDVEGSLPFDSSSLIKVGGCLDDSVYDKSFTVLATREGLVGKTTSSGHTITSNDWFAALPSYSGLYREVEITYNGQTEKAPVYDVGPWYIDDTYWLKDETPQAKKDFDADADNHLITSGPNKGKKSNGAGIDLADGLFRKFTSEENPIEVTWKFVDNRPTINCATSIKAKSYGSDSFYKRVYGDPKDIEKSCLKVIDFRGGKIKVNSVAAPAFECVDKEIGKCDEGNKYNFWSTEGGGVSTFSVRENKNNPSRSSLHSYGIAIDINPITNPNKKGTNCQSDIPPCVVKAFQKYGFVWGCEFDGVKDAMHFEWHGIGPEDLTK